MSVPDSFEWAVGDVRLRFFTGPAAPVALASIVPPGSGHGEPLAPAQPLVEVLAVGWGRAHASTRTVGTAIGRALRYVWHEVSDGGRSLRIVQRGAGLCVTTLITNEAGFATVHAETAVTNEREASITLLAVSSLTLHVPFAGADVDMGNIDLLTGASEWLSENRWTVRRIRDLLADLGLETAGQDARGARRLVGRSTWTTSADLPVGILVDRSTQSALAWEMPHSAPWLVEIGEGTEGLSIAVFGPTDEQHQWRLALDPGQTFRTVPMVLAVSSDGIEGAVRELTRDRRYHRRSVVEMPVVFNDYMNTLMGNPTEKALLPLIGAAAEVGVDVFCIDAGWYDDTTDWFESVGDWVPSARRFPRGLGHLLRVIRSHGLIAGIWLEPEVVGVKSRAAATLPESAFLRRGGERLREQGRFHLDLRSPAACAHLDSVVDRLVGEGIGYFKLDYNIVAGPGSDDGGESPGQSLREYADAHVDWIDSLYRRHPSVVLENCASGAMRQSAGLVAHFNLQSTSDQQDPVRYPPVAAGALLSLLPEQAANWAYPQPGMSNEEIGFTLATGGLGRLYLSGHLDRMTAAQRDLVSEAVQANRSLMRDITTRFPSWPLGLPRWSDPVVAACLSAPGSDILTLWRRQADVDAIRLPFLQHKDGPALKWLGPVTGPIWKSEWADGILTIYPDSLTSINARVVLLTWHD